MLSGQTPADVDQRSHVLPDFEKKTKADVQGLLNCIRIILNSVTSWTIPNYLY